LTGLDISGGDAAVATAITALDTAINTVSSNRGTIGAMQNRFDSLVENLQITTENLAASESRIRDTDMAAEMVEFTKNQVLSQAGTAMLAQANQIPQGILSLLKG
jgi:flagellin